MLLLGNVQDNNQQLGHSLQHQGLFGKQAEPDIAGFGLKLDFGISVKGSLGAGAEAVFQLQHLHIQIRLREPVHILQRVA
ncbi:hypothetical protein D3C76_1442590 [compost metagenome]